MRWNNLSYQRISGVKTSNENIIVSFENGDLVEISKDSLVPFGVQNIEWDRIQNTPFEISIPAVPQSIEIPWDKIRVITDKDFAKHLAQKSEEQSKLIGVKVKRLREKKGINSKELAERAGVTAQTISRIEQGHTDISFATLRKILAALGYSLKDLANEEIQLELETPQKNLNTLLRRLSLAGIDSNLLIKKIIPPKLQVALNARIENQPTLLLDEAASYVSKIYGWTTEEIWNSPNLKIKSDPAAMAFFKKPSNANENQIKAYSHYAYYIARIALRGIQFKDEVNYPESIDEFKSRYYAKYDNLNLISLLEFIWDLGICIVPLSDSGVFHGASWNIDGKHVIVLKQNTKSHARWVFDLLHELFHVFAHLNDANTSVIETDELNPIASNDSVEELEANYFANQIIFEHNAEEIAEECVNNAKWDIKNLTKAVKSISKQKKIGEDFLANYLAFRLSIQGENWWASANKMQKIDPNPFEIAANLLKKRVQVKNLSPMDNNLLLTATSISNYGKEI